MAFAIALSFLTMCFAQERPELPADGVVTRDQQAFMDHDVDYYRFTARITDRDPLTRIIKVQAETPNVRFFRAGDKIVFTIDNRSGSCTAYVRNVEDKYVTFFLPNVHQCKEYDDYLRRGTKINVTSMDFLNRVKESSAFRKSIIIRKEDFLKQLNEINHFLWSYDQIKQETAADVDAQIVELEKKKQHALEELLAKRKDNIILQKELQSKISQLDVDLQFYRIDRQEWLTDRWDLDHDLSLPVGQRPQEEKIVPQKGRRWEKTSFK